MQMNEPTGNPMEERAQNEQEFNEPLTIYTAKWVVPISRPPLENGAVVVKGGKIVEVDHVRNLYTSEKDKVIDYGQAVIFPGMINVHTHLEQPPTEVPIADFVGYQGFLRDFNTHTPFAQQQAIARTNIAECIRCGTVAVADFSTGGAALEPLRESHLYTRLFYEVTGFKNFLAEQLWRRYREKLKEPEEDHYLTAHLAPSAVWNLSPQLLREICLSERHIAIHMGVIEAENEFTLTGEGLLRQMLMAGEDFDYGWKVPGLSAMQYFFRSHFYARHNILIHMVYVSSADLDIAKEFGVKINICLCPRGSQKLSGRSAPVSMLLEKNVNLCLGTESRIVAGDLDIRQEMIKSIDLYGISPEMALKFATLNGAYAIGFHKEVGSLEPGKTAHCLVISCEGLGAQDPFEMITGATTLPYWLDAEK